MIAMGYSAALIAGLLWGITSWLPISDLGNFTTSTLSGFSGYGEYFIPAYLGALMAVLYHFRDEISEGSRRLLFRDVRTEIRFLFYSAMFTLLVGFVLYAGLGARLPPVLADVANAVIGLFIVFCAFAGPIIGNINVRMKGHPDDPSLMDAIVSGIAQGFAAVGGLSRPALTVGSLLAGGVRARRALELSFMMAPIFMTLRLIFVRGESTTLPMPVAFSAFLMAFVVSLALMNGLLMAAEKLGDRKFALMFGGTAVLVCILGVII